MTTAIFLARVLVILTVALHYRVFTTLATHTPRLERSTYNQMMAIILVIFVTHLLEIGLYALDYYWAIESLELGVLAGIYADDPMSYLYYSTVVYTLPRLRRHLPSWSHPLYHRHRDLERIHVNYLVCIIYISGNESVITLE